MTHGSLFAGIGGFDLGFERAGWTTIWQVEIELFCRAVLETGFEHAQRFADIKECGAQNLTPVDCITAGVPCQDVSVAGKRAGLKGEHTGLFYQFARVLQELRPAWFVFENVPGLFSSNSGRDFAEVLRVLMVECGYGVCWRVLDSQFFGVAQRRRRVFIVGCFGKPCPAEVLFEPEGGAGHPAKGREAGQGIAHAIARGAAGSGYRYDTNGEDFVLSPTIGADIGRQAGGHPGLEEYCDAVLAASINSGGNAVGFRTEPGEHIVIQDARGQRDKRKHGIGIQQGGPCYTLDGTSEHAIAYSLRRNERSTSQGPGNYISVHGEDTEAGPHPGDIGGAGLRADESRERREDAQPPDSPSDVGAEADSHGMRDAASLPKGLDSARYRALGNAVTVNVAEWIARRIRNVHQAEE